MGWRLWIVDWTGRDVDAREFIGINRQEATKGRILLMERHERVFAEHGYLGEVVHALYGVRGNAGSVHQAANRGREGVGVEYQLLNS